MAVYVEPIDSLLVECTKEIRWEFHQIRSQIRPDEIYRLAIGLLNRTSLEWPLALLELQQGHTLKRLLHHLNSYSRHYGLRAQRELVFHAPFPILSLRSLQSVAAEHRVTLRTTRCIEFIGNKSWDYALKPVKKHRIPFKIDVATLALNALGCSPKQQQDEALTDLSQRIRGHIINFLYDLEVLLIAQIEEQLSLYKTVVSQPVSEVAV